ncbi:mannose-specific lectin [Selaginella moellendorffii]|uniref:mannose-specific lectin n=1 Tax=Selaginella moellendorffii TaxID=88036 RepID=UPI000D1CB25F|nr:mannose-specific lectin [Selaginella moellendorffii]|eukprot:XP_002962570.2 mannose-specific lectin [Selaginella moellendorffii]
MEKSMAATCIALLLLATIALYCDAAGPPAPASDTLFTNKQLRSNEELRSNNSFFVFKVQSDCNMVLTRVSDSSVLWSSGTGGKAAGCWVTMQGDGNLVLYSNQNNAVWMSKTARKEDLYTLMVQDDGNAVIYTASHVAIWSTSYD